MSAEIESLTVESAARRTGAGGSPTTVALAVIAVLIAAAAHWRLNRAGERLDVVTADIAELNELQRQSSERLLALATQLETKSAAWRNDLEGLRVMPAQLAELGSAVEPHEFLEQCLARPARRADRGGCRCRIVFAIQLRQQPLRLELRAQLQIARKGRAHPGVDL